ncbi:MAG: pyruvate kinase [Candidatus Omnitrophota bacterium]
MLKTKIVATLGPASNCYTVLRKMVMAGLDVARFNFSHGEHEEQLARMNLIRQINRKYRRRILILQDLEGFRIRVGRFNRTQAKELKKHGTVFLVKGRDTGDPAVIPIDYAGDMKKIRPGQDIFIDDGNIALKAVSNSQKQVKACVVVGGILKERKGINMPGLRIPFSGLTHKDRVDLEFGIKHRVDWVAQSFVRTRKDIETVKRAVKPHLPDCQVIAKIENKEAIKNIDDIIDASDGIMVARGDMGVALPIYEIPMIQKLIIRKCNQKKKFVITATEMLEHMTEHIRPTRAEVTDVANAILDGTNYVMLSAESAAGQYPVESVRMMNEIIKFTEMCRKKHRL